MRECGVLVVLLVAVAAACASPAPVTERPPAPPVSSAAPRYGAPVVTEPRELRGRGTPCQLVGMDTLEKLAYKTPGTPRLVAGLTPACVWEGARSHRLSVAVWLERDYLVDVYRSRVLPVFRPVSISGLPAVEQQTRLDSPFCTTTIGVGDSEALDVSMSVDAGRTGVPAADPCAEGRRVAEAIVATLPPKAG